MRYGLVRILCTAALLGAGMNLHAPQNAQADEVSVFAAVSLKGPLDEIAAEFEAASEHHVTFSFAGTPVLARHIALGAPADVFISANRSWMDWVDAEGAVLPGSRQDLLSNELVLIAHGQDAQHASLDAPSLRARLGQDRIALALVDAVPAGIYGKAALVHTGVWDQIEPQIVQTDNVRAALALVALGEAGFGVVYKTDALAENRVTAIATFPPESHPRITYPMAIVATQMTEPIRAFTQYLTGPKARVVFERHGFSVVAGSP